MQSYIPVKPYSIVKTYNIDYIIINVTSTLQIYCFVNYVEIYLEPFISPFQGLQKISSIV
jgi:hypothetical protein